MDEVLGVVANTVEVIKEEEAEEVEAIDVLLREAEVAVLSKDVSKISTEM